MFSFDIDYQSFLAQHNLVYEFPPRYELDGFPLGNGHLGGMVYAPHPGEIEFDINKLDIWDRRYANFELTTHSEVMKILEEKGPSYLSKCLMEKEGKGMDSPYPVPKRCGSLRIWSKIQLNFLPLDISVRDERFELELYNATLDISYKTNISNTLVNIFVYSKDNIIVIKEKDWCERRLIQRFELFRNSDIFIETKPQIVIEDDYIGIRYTFPDGFEYIILAKIDANKLRKKSVDNRIWYEFELNKGENEHLLLITVVTSKDSDSPLLEAKRKLETAFTKGYDILLKEHKNWWHSFWEKSFIELNDKFLENLWYFELYLLASTSRGKIAPGLYGLWGIPENPGWHGCYTGDINVQMTYWPIFSSNHIELGEPFFETFSKMLPKVKEETKRLYGIEGAKYPVDCIEDGREFACSYYRYIQCTSALYAQLFWWGYLYTKDLEFLKNIAYPVMRECLLFYQNYLKKDNNGKYYIYPSFSPEQGPEWTKNPTMDLSLIKYLAKATIEASLILEVDERERVVWQDILENLSDYPIKDGYLLDSEYADNNTQLAHPSLLSPVFPAGEIERGHPLFEVAKRTLAIIPSRTWRRSLKNDFTWDDSFSWPWLACISARLEMGDKALSYLNYLIKQHLKPNGLFSMWTSVLLDENEFPEELNKSWFYPYTSTTYEGRRLQGAFVESGSGFITAINEMLLQSYNGIIKVFPAMPKSWSFVRFKRLRAVGAFLVSSEYNLGNISWIIIESDEGGACKVLNPWNSLIKVVNIETKEELIYSEDIVEFPTNPGSTYLIVPKSTDISKFRIDSVKGVKRARPRIYLYNDKFRICLGREKDL